MKKSQLRNIIKESIKELVKETAHTTPCPQGTARLRMTPCPGTTNRDGSLFSTAGIELGSCVTVNGQQPTQANIGNVVNFYDYAGPVALQMGLSSLKFKISGIIPTGQANNNFAPIYNLLTTTCDPTGPRPFYGCVPNAPFPPNFNLSSWTSTWTNSGPFNSSNPNQPCNFICGKRNQWVNQLNAEIQLWRANQLNAGGMGPRQINALACKFAEAENQYQIHGCAQMNTNNCP
jgi:hypothetical protein